MCTCVNHPDRKHHAKRLCSTCYNRQHRKKIAAKMSKAEGVKFKEDTKKKTKNRRYLREYGITLQQVEEMKKKQKNRCAICGKVHKELHVDHHHDTETVRGLLCGTCNRGIGNLKECTTTLLNAVKYLLYWSTRYEKNTNV